MLQTLPGFLAAHWLYLAGGVALCGVLCYFSEKFAEGLKKAAVLVAVLFILGAGYELITGRDLFSLPGTIDRQLSQEQDKTETGRRYYRSFEERYGAPPEK
ncbi:MAG: hypothetical protein RBR09_06965 [Desulfobulbaceae bacterium]|jgi:hypothetical protein|nr:hypothetical protein [Desulfobulbaceae bacterium]MDY0350975.1 hypothetical protein [Desulfobulbaceae bacterium]